MKEMSEVLTRLIRFLKNHYINISSCWLREIAAEPYDWYSRVSPDRMLCIWIETRLSKSYLKKIKRKKAPVLRIPGAEEGLDVHKI